MKQAVSRASSRWVVGVTQRGRRVYRAGEAGSAEAAPPLASSSSHQNWPEGVNQAEGIWNNGGWSAMAQNGHRRGVQVLCFVGRGVKKIWSVGLQTDAGAFVG